MKVLVTGAAGFIGSHVAQALLERGETVLGVDNLNDYYDVRLKQARLERLRRHAGFRFFRANIADQDAMHALCERESDTDSIVHLAAQAGVRHSLINPYVYVESNVMGQVVMLEAARRLRALRHFVYASSSSVYGANDDTPFSVNARVDQPVSLYAATKRGGELIARTYAHLFGVPSTGLRFFSVYGPWGRPDMAAFLFTDAILNGRPVRVFNAGQMQRDFTYIDDITAGVVAALDRPPAQDSPPCRLYNLGNERPEKLEDFLALLEQIIGRPARKIMEPMQPGDVVATFADISDSRRDLGFDPKISLQEGLTRFVAWYRGYHNLS